MIAKGLHLSTAFGAMRIVNSLNFQDMIASLGIHEPEWKLLTSKTPWMAKHRPIVEKLCKSLIFSSLDLMGVPRFTVPAEFVASVGVSFISECNYLHFSQWCGSYAKAEELGNYDGSRTGPIEGLEKVSAPQLFALMCELRSDERCNTICRRFNDKTSEYLTDPMETNNEEKEEQPKKHTSKKN